MTQTRRNFTAYHNATLPRKDSAMLTPERITTVAKNAAYVAYTVLGLDCPYSVTFINEPELAFDGLLSNKAIESLNATYSIPNRTLVSHFS